MSPDQRKDCIKLSDQNLLESGEKAQPHTLEEFSYDHFRCLNALQNLSTLLCPNGKVLFLKLGKGSIVQTKRFII